MFRFDMPDERDVGVPPPSKRSCLEMVLPQEDDIFFPDDSCLSDWPLFDVDDIGIATTNFSQTFCSNEMQDQSAYQQFTTPSKCDSTAAFPMPYVFPVQSCTSYHYPMPGVSIEKCDGKDSLTLKGEHEIRDSINKRLLEFEQEDPSPQAVFCKVPSRTAVQKPKLLTVTVGEIYRRCFGPEMMNVSLLGSYLRRAKEKDGGKTLRSELYKRRLVVPLGRRKNGSTTTWTCFVEEEAQAMAVDLDLAMRKFFPVQEFAQAIKEKANASDVELQSSTYCLRNVLRVMRQVFSEDRSPVHGRENEKPILRKELQDGLYRFSCATHGFGSLALISAIDLFDALMDAVLEFGFCKADGGSPSSCDSF